MKRKCFILALFILGSATNYALRAEDMVTSLKITTEENAEEVAIARIQSIKYDETKMLISTTDGEQLTFDLENVKSMEYSSMPSAVAKIFAGNNEGAQYTITSLNGQVVAQGIVTDGKCNSSPALDKGVYLITIGKETKKVVIK